MIVIAAHRRARRRPRTWKGHRSITWPSARPSPPRPFWNDTLLLLLTLLSIVSWSQALRSESLPRPHKRDYKRIESLQTLASSQDASTVLDFRQSSSLLASILVPRKPDTPENAKVRATLLKPFQRKDSKWTVEEHKFVANTPQGEKHMTNLIVTYNAGAPRTLVLSAHHDSKVTPEGFIGATDSAVPCAIIVDTALAVEKLLEEAQRTADAGGGAGGVTDGSQQHERGQDTALQLIFFDGEEAYEQWTQTDSVYGSRALASTWSRSFFTPQLVKRRDTPAHMTMRTIDAIDHFVLLDLLGAPNPRIPSFYYGTDWMHQELISAEERLASAGLLYPKDASGNPQLPPAGGYGTPLLPAATQLQQQEQRHSFFARGSPHVGGIDDDHRPFLQNGVPILHLIPTPFPHVWHQMSDDASALDYPTIHAWAMIMRVFVAEYLGLEPQAKALMTRDDAKGRSHDQARVPSALRRSVSELVSGFRGIKGVFARLSHS